MIYSKWDKDSAMQIRDHPSIVGRIMQGKAYNRQTSLTTLMPTRVFAKKFLCVLLPAIRQGRQGDSGFGKTCCGRKQQTSPVCTIICMTTDKSVEA
jgi:hypothetical protein